MHIKIRSISTPGLFEIYSCLNQKFGPQMDSPIFRTLIYFQHFLLWSSHYDGLQNSFKSHFMLIASVTKPAFFERFSYNAPAKILFLKSSHAVSAGPYGKKRGCSICEFLNDMKSSVQLKQILNIFAKKKRIKNAILIFKIEN